MRSFTLLEVPWTPREGPSPWPQAPGPPEKGLLIGPRPLERESQYNRLAAGWCPVGSSDTQCCSQRPGLLLFAELLAYLYMSH